MSESYDLNLNFNDKGTLKRLLSNIQGLDRGIAGLGREISNFHSNIVNSAKAAEKAFKGLFTSALTSRFGKIITEYNKLLFDISRTSRITGQSFHQLKLSIDDLSSATSLSRDEAAAFMRQMQDGVRGIRMSASETAEFAKTLSKEFGPSLKDVQGAMQSLLGIQSKEVNVLRRIRDGMGVKEVGAYAVALMQVHSVSEKQIEVMMRTAFAHKKNKDQVSKEEQNLLKLSKTMQEIQKAGKNLLIEFGEPMAEAMTTLGKAMISAVNGFNKLSKSPTFDKILKIAPYLMGGGAVVAGIGGMNLGLSSISKLFTGGGMGMGMGAGTGRNVKSMTGMSASFASALTSTGPIPVRVVNLPGMGRTEVFPTRGGRIRGRGRGAGIGGMVSKIAGKTATLLGGLFKGYMVKQTAGLVGSVLKESGHGRVGGGVTAAGGIIGSAIQGGAMAAMLGPEAIPFGLIGGAITGLIANFDDLSEAVTGTKAAEEARRKEMESRKKAAASRFLTKAGIGNKGNTKQQAQAQERWLRLNYESIKNLKNFQGKAFADLTMAQKQAAVDLNKKITDVEKTTGASRSDPQAFAAAAYRRQQALMVGGKMGLKGKMLEKEVSNYLHGMRSAITQGMAKYGGQVKGGAMAKTRGQFGGLMANVDEKKLNEIANKLDVANKVRAYSEISAEMQQISQYANSILASTDKIVSYQMQWGTDLGKAASAIEASKQALIVQRNTMIELRNKYAEIVGDENKRKTYLADMHDKLKKENITQAERARIENEIKMVLSGQLTAESAIAEVSGKINEQDLRRQKLTDELVKSSDMETTLLESKVALSKALYLGLGPTLDLQIKTVNQIEKSISLLNQQLEIARKNEQLHPGVQKYYQERVSLETRIANLQKKQLDTTKNLREGYLDALQAFTNVEGAFGKIVLTRETGIGEMMRKFQAPGGMRLGKIGAGGASPFAQWKAGGGLQFAGRKEWNKRALSYDAWMKPLPGVINLAAAEQATAGGGQFQRAQDVARQTGINYGGAGTGAIRNTGQGGLFGVTAQGKSGRGRPGGGTFEEARKHGRKPGMLAGEGRKGVNLKSVEGRTGNGLMNKLDIIIGLLEQINNGGGMTRGGGGVKNAPESTNEKALKDIASKIAKLKEQENTPKTIAAIKDLKKEMKRLKALSGKKKKLGENEEGDTKDSKEQIERANKNLKAEYDRMIKKNQDKMDKYLAHMRKNSLDKIFSGFHSRSGIGARGAARQKAMLFHERQRTGARTFHENRRRSRRRHAQTAQITRSDGTRPVAGAHQKELDDKVKQDKKRIAAEKAQYKKLGEMERQARKRSYAASTKSGKFALTTAAMQQRQQEREAELAKNKEALKAKKRERENIRISLNAMKKQKGAGRGAYGVGQQGWYEPLTKGVTNAYAGATQGVRNWLKYMVGQKIDGGAWDKVAAANEAITERLNKKKAKIEKEIAAMEQSITAQEKNTKAMDAQLKARKKTQKKLLQEAAQASSKATGYGRASAGLAKSMDERQKKLRADEAKLAAEKARRGIFVGGKRWTPEKREKGSIYVAGKRVKMKDIKARHAGITSVASLAKGGSVPSSDTVPAMLTPGEFVVNKHAAQKNERLLRTINDGYAHGGKVDRGKSRNMRATHPVRMGALGGALGSTILRFLGLRRTPTHGGKVDRGKPRNMRATHPVRMGALGGALGSTILRFLGLRRTPTQTQMPPVFARNIALRRPRKSKNMRMFKPRNLARDSRRPMRKAKNMRVVKLRNLARDSRRPMRKAKNMRMFKPRNLARDSRRPMHNVLATHPGRTRLDFLGSAFARDMPVGRKPRNLAQEVARRIELRRLMRNAKSTMRVLKTHVPTTTGRYPTEPKYQNVKHWLRKYEAEKKKNESLPLLRAAQRRSRLQGKAFGNVDPAAEYAIARKSKLEEKRMERAAAGRKLKPVSDAKWMELSAKDAHDAALSIRARKRQKMLKARKFLGMAEGKVSGTEKEIAQLERSKTEATSPWTPLDPSQRKKIIQLANQGIKVKTAELKEAQKTLGFRRALVHTSEKEYDAASRVTDVTFARWKEAKAKTVAEDKKDKQNKAKQAAAKQAAKQIKGKHVPIYLSKQATNGSAAAAAAKQVKGKHVPIYLSKQAADKVPQAGERVAEAAKKQAERHAGITNLGIGGEIVAQGKKQLDQAKTQTEAIKNVQKSGEKTEQNTKKIKDNTKGKSSIALSDIAADKFKTQPTITETANLYGTGKVKYAALGGAIHGTDTVPAMLTPGEFVVNKRAAQSHMALLTAINSRGYAAGGIVSPPPSMGGGGGGFSPKFSINVRGDSVNSILKSVHLSLGKQLNDMMTPSGTSGRFFDLPQSG